MKQLIFAILLMPYIAMAIGQERGNGGDVIVCRNNQGVVVSAEILDVYEARTLRGLELNFIQGLWQDKVKNAISRLSDKSPYRAQKYQEWMANFLNDSRFVQNVNLPDIDDSNELLLPNDNCQKLQIAIQQEPKFAKDPRYIINEQLWQLLNEDNKAALVLHEIIYREGIHDDFKDSRSVRYLNSILFSNLITQMSSLDFALEVLEMKFNAVEYRGGVFSSPHFKDKSLWPLEGSAINNGFVNQIYFLDGKVEVAAGLLGKNFEPIVLHGNFKGITNLGRVKILVPEFGGRVEISSSGDIANIDMNLRAGQLSSDLLQIASKKVFVRDILGRAVEFDFGLFISLTEMDISVSSGKTGGYSACVAANESECLWFWIAMGGYGPWLDFNELGQVKTGTLVRPQEISVQGKMITVENRIDFYESGKVLKCWVKNPVKLLDQNNMLVSIKANSSITLDENERVISTSL